MSLSVGSRTRTGAEVNAYKKVIKTTQDWIYSWIMRVGCETKEEVHISLHLLLYYIKSDRLKKIGPENSSTLLECLRRYIIPHLGFVLSLQSEINSS
jgi:hypothetical protein